MFGRQNKITQALRMQVNTLQSSIEGFRESLAGLIGLSHGGQRDIYKEYGYVSNPSFAEYYSMAIEHPMANRLVFGIPKLCWRDGFKVFASADDDAPEVLEDEVLKLNKMGLSKALERADALARIGKFSCIYVGVPDGLSPEQPLGRVRGDWINKLYFRVFAYDGIEISDFETDVTSPRYGLPSVYQVEKQNRGNNKDTQVESMRIHYSRIVHIVESPLDSEIEGVPYLQPIFNTLRDIMKTCGGSAEAYFRNAQRIIVTEIDPKFASTLASDQAAQEKISQKAKDFTNKMQNQLMTAGGKTSQLQANHASPMDTFKVGVYQVCAYSGMPVRAFTGEGGGQYSGEEDQLAVANLVGDRQRMNCSQMVYGVFNILKECGGIALTGNEEVVFNLQEASTESRKSEINERKARTLLSVTQAKSQVGGDEIDMDSALTALGLEEIKTESIGDE